MEKRDLETTVGFFVLLGVVLFFIIVFFISGIYLFRDGYHMKIEYDYCAGLSKGASVRLAGVKVGEVNKITVGYDEVSGKPKAVVDVWLDRGAVVREDYKPYIMGTFALNETLIEIVPGDEPEAAILHDGDMLKGVSPIPMEKIVEEGTAILDKFSRFADYVYAVVGDEELREDLRSTIVDMSTLLAYAKKIITEKDEEINGLIENANGSLMRLDKILTAIDNGEGTLGKLIKDDEFYRKLDATIEEIKLETKDLIREIKLHPWRLMKKDKKKKKKKK